MTVYVVNASFVVDATCGFPAADPYLGFLATGDALAAPANLDAEVLSALGRLHRDGRLTKAAARVAALASFGANRWPVAPLVEGPWPLTG